MDIMAASELLLCSILVSNSINIDLPLSAALTPPPTPILIQPVHKMAQAQSNETMISYSLLLLLAERNWASSTLFALPSVSPRRFYYDGDDGVYTAHDGDRSRFPPLRLADTAVNVSHVQNIR